MRFKGTQGWAIFQAAGSGVEMRRGGLSGLTTLMKAVGNDEGFEVEITDV